MQAVFTQALLLGAPKLQREDFDALVERSPRCDPDLQQQLQRCRPEVDSQAALQATTEGLRKALKKLPGSDLYSE